MNRYFVTELPRKPYRDRTWAIVDTSPLTMGYVGSVKSKGTYYEAWSKDIFLSKEEAQKELDRILEEQ